MSDIACFHFSLPSELMFAVYLNGDIVKCSTGANPCKIISEWKCKDPQSKSFIDSKLTVSAG